MKTRKLTGKALTGTGERDPKMIKHLEIRKNPLKEATEITVKILVKMISQTNLREKKKEKKNLEEMSLQEEMSH